jgi:multimeric flavodoxin WrbA
MRIVILNGNPSAGSTAFESYLDGLSRTLAAGGHMTTTSTLRDMDIGQCRGCWGCWVKTPGECVIRDDAARLCRDVINADWLVYASPVTMGFPSALLKRAMDRLIPLIHPYGVVDRGEAHHKARYERYPKVGLLLEAGDASADDLRLIGRMFSRTALNFKNELYFLRLTTDPVEEVAKALAEKTVPKKGLPAPRLAATNAGLAIAPPARLTLFNGSPRGKGGNTEILLTRFAEGFLEGGGREYEIHHLIQANDMTGLRDVFSAAECVMLGFPLYTDAMPGVVKAFIEELSPLRGKEGNPPIAFLVQSGFPEALHSRYVESYLADCAVRLGSPYLGTIVRGNGEGVRSMSAEQNRKLFETLHELGEGFARTGRFEPEVLRRIANLERFPAILGPLFKLMLRLPIASADWDRQLKSNGAYERRFARPNAETDR